jgi:hypothetical protein
MMQSSPCQIRIGLRAEMPAPSTVVRGARLAKQAMKSEAEIDDGGGGEDTDNHVAPDYQTRPKKRTTPGRSEMDEIARAADAKSIRVVLPAFSERERGSHAQFTADVERYCAQNNVAFYIRSSLKYDIRNR